VNGYAAHSHTVLLAHRIISPLSTELLSRLLFHPYTCILFFKRLCLLIKSTNSLNSSSAYYHRRTQDFIMEQGIFKDNVTGGDIKLKEHGRWVTRGTHGRWVTRGTPGSRFTSPRHHAICIYCWTSHFYVTCLRSIAPLFSV